MANLNLGQDVANKGERKQTATHKFSPPQLAVRMGRYGSLITINPSSLQQVAAATVVSHKKETED